MFGFGKTALERALERYGSGGAEWSATVGSAAEEGVRTPAEARALARVVSAIAEDPARFPDHASAVFLLQQPGSEQVIGILREQALPAVARILQRHAALAGDPFANLPMAAAKIAVLYRDPPAVTAMAAMAAKGHQADHFLWEPVFQAAAEVPGLNTALAAKLGQHLPQGFCAVAFLDFCNTLARAGELSRHPFDSAEGHGRLAAWIADREHASYAQSAAAALPHLAAGEARDRLFAAALAHPDDPVRIEAAWAAAKLGEEPGFAALIEAASDPIRGHRALPYLEELGAAERIPPASRTPAFRAMAEMVGWLCHPQEYGKPPVAVSVLDQRRLRWPPRGGEETDLTLVAFRYADGDRSDAGVGCVGSVTFGLRDETLATLPPEEIYAHYCAWELAHRDPRFASMDAALAKRMLAELNPGFGR